MGRAVRVPARRSRPTGRTWRIQSPHGTIFDFGSSPADWTLSLPQAPTTRLGLTMNAGTASIDMSGAALSSLGLTANAG